MSFHLLLVDAEIERLPSESNVGPDLCTRCLPGADRQKVRVLESYLHRDLLSIMSERSRRGRPDIAHSFLVLALGSALRAEGRLDVLVHTRNNSVIRFARRAEVEKDYISFLGTLTTLFERGHVGEGDSRITIEEEISLRRLLEILELDSVVALSPNGKKEDLHRIMSGLRDKEVGIIIGGFPEGDYLSPVYELADFTVSLGDELLTVPDVAARVLAAIP